MTTNLPVIAGYVPDRTFAWHEGSALSCGQALADMLAIARQLQAGRPCINLCEKRYRFIVAFAAVGLAGGVNLLPQSHAEETLALLRDDYPEAQTIDDEQVGVWLAAACGDAVPTYCPGLTAAHRMAQVFTSGSTGRPGRHEKSWGSLVLGGCLYRQRFFPDGRQPHTVATVPPQHMYGLETSVVPPLQLGHAVDTCRPFMPWTIADALTRLPEPRLLITTPVHLRTCFDAGVTMPRIAGIISATAPLATELAVAVEHTWRCEVREIYGSTETGSVASRRTATTDVWELYDDMRVSGRDGVWLHSPQLAQPFRLNDDIEILDDSRFRLRGRNGDMLKLAGKRMSINDLTRHLLAVDGVHDAAVFNPDGDGDTARPAALVVAPGASEQKIRACLAQAVDSVFVPRPLLRVDALPRNELGKLPQRQLLALLQQAKAR